MKTLRSLGLIFALVTCSSSTGGGGTTPTGPLTIDTFASAYYGAVCSALFRCPTVNDSGTGVALAGSAAECPARIARFGIPSILDLVSLVRGGTVRFDGAAASECLATLSQVCGATTTNFQSVCRRAFTGTVAANGGCWRSEECVAGTFCDHEAMSGRACPGTCRPQVAAGAACAVDRQCTGWEDGRSICSGATTCAAIQDGPAAGIGQRCGEVDGTPVMRVQCSTGLACVGAMCRAVIPAGAPCATGDACAAGTLCVQVPGTTTRTCASPDSLVRNTQGASCNPDGRNPPLCNPLLRLTCSAGTCTQLGDGTLGARCTPGGDINAASCNEGLRCDATTRTCVARLAVGATCDDDTDCLSSVCFAMRCLAHVCN